MIEPVTTSLIFATAKDLVTDELKTTVVDFLKEKAIGRWTEHRAKRFLSSFIEEVRKEKDVLATSADLNEMLRSVAEHDEQTSTLFDAYRRVALSASKDLGPMIIGLLTANIVLAGREATRDEEQLFEAAEILNDRDFSSFRNWMSYLHSDENYQSTVSERASQEDQRSPYALLVRGGSALPEELVLDPETLFGPEEQSFDIYTEVGAFAHKLKSVGLLSELIQPRGYPRNPQGNNYYVRIHPAIERLHRLMTRAHEAAAIYR
ncbi:hypothetical protein [Paraburkholderia caribensis]|uniref:hypothetical protein n=1 Tax=Paraburkholderia caribensis TaxID=75105 RepID=UPI0031CE3515